LLGQDAAERDAAQVAAALETLGHEQTRLAEAAAQLQKAGPYQDAFSEGVRQLRREVLAAKAQLLEQAGRLLRKGAGWTEDEQNAFDLQRQRVRELDQRWRRLHSTGHLDRTTAPTEPPAPRAATGLDRGHRPPAHDL